MSEIQSAAAPSSYLRTEAHFPFCKGCGHHHITHAIDRALVLLGLDPHLVCITSDIGCVGLVDTLFGTVHTFHTTHGRSTAFATGVELADSILDDSNVKSLVVIGDGGAMIGLLHLVNAAQLNVDVTVILYNNFLFGMTGGQNSGFSPSDFVTTTTPHGNIIPPIDIITLLKGANAGFLARKTATDADLDRTIAEAIRYPGFALVEVLELCTEYALRGNTIRGNRLAEISPGHVLELGIIESRTDRAEFGEAYRKKSREQGPAGKPHELTPHLGNSLERRMGIVIAGTAGERVQFSAHLLVEAAVISGANATQKNDNPVTQGTGFSLSEVVLSRDEIRYTGIDRPDVVIVVSEDGSRELEAAGVFSRAGANTLIVADESLTLPACSGTVLKTPLRREHSGPGAALAGILTAVGHTGILSVEAFREVAGSQKNPGALLKIIDRFTEEKSGRQNGEV